MHLKTIANVSAALLLVLPGCREPELRPFPEPPKTTWAPADVRPASAVVNDPVLGDRNRFRTFHADALNSDEVEIAFAPMFEQGWIAESQFYVPEGPTFDADGNLYFVPARPKEKVLLVSVDLEGERRWAVPGDRPGMGGAPLILNHPETPGEERIYAGSYESLLALDTSGEVIWDVPTGLEADGRSALVLHNWGLNYDASSDAVLAVLGDGHVIAHRRLDGQRLTQPFLLPGSPAADPQPIRSQIVRSLAWIARALGSHPAADLVDSKQVDPVEIVDALMGTGSVVSNYFSIDPSSGKVWIASTAPDADDGTIDGRSDYGALYALHIRQRADGWSLEEHCRYVFQGGSSSTPALRADGSRIYLGDGTGNLLAIDADCNEIWRIDVGEKLMASVAVSSDNGELYAVTATAVKKVVDHGDHATREWNASLDMFEGAATGNLSTAGIGANGVMIHVGGGLVFGGTVYPRKLGIALLDRETGLARYAALGVQESIAAMTTNVDGAVYLAHSPIRVLFTPGPTGRSNGKLIGGIGQYRPVRTDLLARDAVCAAAGRASNAGRHREMPREAARAEARQITALIAQARDAAQRAVASRDLHGSERAELESLLDLAAVAIAAAHFDTAETPLTAACARFE